jgi:Uncharacterized ACR, COG1993
MDVAGHWSVSSRARRGGVASSLSAGPASLINAFRPADPAATNLVFGVRWVPVPAGGDRGGGSLVLAVRPVVPRLAERGVEVDHVTQPPQRSGHPVAIIIVDSSPRIRAFLPQIDELVTEGLMIVDPVHVVRYVGRPARRAS